MVNILATIILIWLAFAFGLAILFFAWRLVLVAALFGVAFLFFQFKHEAESARHRTEQQVYASHVAADWTIPKLVPLNP